VELLVTLRYNGRFGHNIVAELGRPIYRGVQLTLQIGHRTGLGRRRSPPSDGRNQLPPGIQQVGIDAQLLPNHLSGLPAVQPVRDRFAFEVSSNFGVLGQLFVS